MGVLDNLELAFAIAVGLGLGGWIAGIGLRSQLRTLVLEVLAQPKVTQLIQAASSISHVGKGRGGLLGLAQGFLGPLLSNWAQAAQQGGAGETPPGLFRMPPPPPPG